MVVDMRGAGVSLIECLDDVYDIINRIIPKLFFRVEIEDKNVFIYVPKSVKYYVLQEILTKCLPMYILIDDYLCAVNIRVVGE